MKNTIFSPMNLRIGFGYDVHKLTNNRKLILGGIEIDYKLGLNGHSDADVLLHSLIDAFLGAAKLGDIGENFPDTNIKFKGISSITLLMKVYEKLCTNNFEIINIDSTIVAQEPKLNFYFPNMCKKISNVLNIKERQISIKAKTEENLGFTGNLLGIKAYSSILLYLNES